MNKIKYLYKIFQRNNRNETETIENIFDSLELAILIKNKSGKIIKSNKIFKDLIKNLDINEKSINSISCEEQYVIETKKKLCTEKALKTKNNTKEWHKIYRIPIFNNKNNVHKIIIIIKNIHKEKMAEEEKNTFVATIIHDLKNPILAHIQALNMLKQGYFGEITEKQNTVVQQILNSSKYLSNLVKTILNIYKYENGKLKIIPEKFNINKELDEICKTYSFMAKDKNQTIKLISKERDITVEADKTQIKRVISNLINNAITHGDRNSYINTEIKTQDKNIIFKVSNKSKYIPKEKMKDAFKKYKSGMLNSSGTGLGLYLSKCLIDKHNGTMIAESNKNNINTFGFSISKDYQEKHHKQKISIT